MRLLSSSLILGALAGAALADDALPLPTMGNTVKPETGRWVFTLVPKAFQRNPELQMTVICELTDFGRTQPAVTAEQPAYFIDHDNGMKQYGQPYAGVHAPDQAYLDRIIQRSLSSNGYLPADDLHRPSLVLFYTWGAHSALDADLRSKFPELARQQEIERSNLVGGQNFVNQFVRDLDSFPGTLDNSVRHQYLVDETRSDLYFVVVSAYDYAALTQNRRQLVWRTKLTVDAQGMSMSETLVPLVLTAAPYFGRDMKDSEYLARPIRRGSVKLGPMNVLQTDVPAPKN